jgi:uncharacterized Zn-binding protein involved in type VI secretion
VSLQPVARVGDTAEGICYAHGSPVHWTGQFNIGSGGFTVDGNNAVVIGDTGPTSCGHTFKCITGSPIFTGLGIPVGRVTDLVIVIQGGNGTIITGSPTTSSE